jgi:hypothetical protein
MYVNTSPLFPALTQMNSAHFYKTTQNRVYNHFESPSGAVLWLLIREEREHVMQWVEWQRHLAVMTLSLSLVKF